jgi:hypothetical protein
MPLYASKIAAFEVFQPNAQLCIKAPNRLTIGRARLQGKKKSLQLVDSAISAD